jgi:hypothetical protein
MVCVAWGQCRDPCGPSPAQKCFDSDIKRAKLYTTFGDGLRSVSPYEFERSHQSCKAGTRAKLTVTPDGWPQYSTLGGNDCSLDLFVFRSWRADATLIVISVFDAFCDGDLGHDRLSLASGERTFAFKSFLETLVLFKGTKSGTVVEPGALSCLIPHIPMQAHRMITISFKGRIC